VSTRQLTLGAAELSLLVRVVLNSVQAFGVAFYLADGVTPANMIGKTVQLELGGATPIVWTAVQGTGLFSHQFTWTLTAAQSLAHGSRGRDATLVALSGADRQVIATGSTELC
jgi:hypothetical protein